MRQGTPFEVEKEVFDRAKANSINKDAKYFYMATADKERLLMVFVQCSVFLLRLLLLRLNQLSAVRVKNM